MSLPTPPRTRFSKPEAAVFISGARRRTAQKDGKGLNLCAGGFSKPCGYVASVRWGWGTCDQKERIVSVLLDTTAFELADQRPEKYCGTGSRLLPIRNRAEDIRWAKAKIHWLFKQAGVRCPPIVVVQDQITAAPE